MSVLVASAHVASALVASALVASELNAASVVAQPAPLSSHSIIFLHFESNQIKARRKVYSPTGWPFVHSNQPFRIIHVLLSDRLHELFNHSKRLARLKMASVYIRIPGSFFPLRLNSCMNE